MPRRIMKDFRIDEISAVTDPAIFTKSATDPTRFRKCAPATIHTSEEPEETDTMHEEFDNLVAKFKKQGMSGTDAMVKAREAMPEVMEPENNLGLIEDFEPAPVSIAKSASVIAFEKRVAEIHSAENISKSRAMIEARRRYPEEFDAYRRAAN